MNTLNLENEIRELTRKSIKESLISGMTLWEKQGSKQMLFGGYPIYSLTINIPMMVNGMVNVTLVEGRLVTCKTNLRIIKDNVALSPFDVKIEGTDTGELDEVVEKIMVWLGTCNNFIYF